MHFFNKAYLFPYADCEARQRTHWPDVCLNFAFSLRNNRKHDAFCARMQSVRCSVLERTHISATYSYAAPVLLVSLTRKRRWHMNMNKFFIRQDGPVQEYYEGDYQNEAYFGIQEGL